MWATTYCFSYQSFANFGHHILFAQHNPIDTHQEWYNINIDMNKYNNDAT